MSRFNFRFASGRDFHADADQAQVMGMKDAANAGSAFIAFTDDGTLSAVVNMGNLDVIERTDDRATDSTAD